MYVIKWVKRVVVSGIAAGSTLLIAACYGVYDESYIVRGFVNSAEEPVPGLQVCVNAGQDSVCGITDGDGYFSIDTHNLDYNESGFLVCVKDIDGDSNGSIQEECMYVEAHVESPVNIRMNVQEQEQTQATVESQKQ